MKYETAIGVGKFLVLVYGAQADVDRARTILAAKGTPDVTTYSSPKH